MVNLTDFLIDLLEIEKGRELKTVSERRAYSPYGYCISPLPTLNGRIVCLCQETKSLDKA